MDKSYQNYHDRICDGWHKCYKTEEEIKRYTKKKQQYKQQVIDFELREIGLNVTVNTLEELYDLRKERGEDVSAEWIGKLERRLIPTYIYDNVTRYSLSTNNPNPLV